MTVELSYLKKMCTVEKNGLFFYGTKTYRILFSLEIIRNVQEPPGSSL